MKEIFVLYSIPKNSPNLVKGDTAEDDTVEGVSEVLNIETILVPDGSPIVSGGKQSMTTLTLLTIIVEGKIISVPSEMCRAVEQDKGVNSESFVL